MVSNKELEGYAYGEAVKEGRSEDEILDDVALRAQYSRIDRGLKTFARELVTDLRKGNLPYKDVQKSESVAKLGDMFQILTLQSTEEYLNECRVIQEVIEVYVTDNEGKPIGNPTKRFVRKKSYEEGFMEYEEYNEPENGSVTVVHRNVVYDVDAIDMNFVDPETGISVPIFDIKSYVRKFIMSGSIGGWLTDRLITTKKEVGSGQPSKGWFR